MSTLLLRFAAPLQSWGLDKFERRGTSRFPTKSAVIGMAMAALGMKRDREIPKDLLNLRFGVRCDDEGIVIRDYHTVKATIHNKLDVESVKKIHKDKFILTVIPSINHKDIMYETDRYYLCDAVFLVGLEGDGHFLEELKYAFRNPVYPIYLGRKSCPPEGKVVLGIRSLTLEQALKQEKWLLPQWRQEERLRKNNTVNLRLVFDANVNDKGYYVEDMPVSFDYRYRRYGIRKVTELPPLVIRNSLTQEHDAYATAKGEEQCTYPG